jgi:hypothetical protein
MLVLMPALMVILVRETYLLLILQIVSKKVYNISNITSISNALNVLIALACLVLCTQYILYLLKNPGLTPELTSKIIFLNILNISERTPERTPELISKFVSKNQKIITKAF